jgi:hypothetical protein
VETPAYAWLYDAFYYAHDCGLPYQRSSCWLDHFGAIADQIVSRIAPRTVLDAGCAMGFLVEGLRQRGVEAYGVDISDYAIGQVHPDVRPYCRVGSICDSFPQQYDLIVCIEILEHMPASEAPAAIANLCRHADDILFSSTPSDYREVTHLNVQPPEHWAEMFAQHGFFRDMDFDAAFILPWAMRVRRKAEPLPRLVREYERRFWLLWQENVELRQSNREARSQRARFEEANKRGIDSAELLAETEWLRTQVRCHRQRGLNRRIGVACNALHFPRFLGNRLIRRLPSLARRPVCQTFVAEHDNLCGISAFLENQPHSTLSPLHITLAEADNPDRPVVTRLVSARHLPLWDALTINFEPLGRIEGQSFVVTFDAPEASPDDSLYLWRYLRAARPNGALRWGDQLQRGELILSARYGIHPDSFADKWRARYSPTSLPSLAALLKSLSGALGRE